MIDDPHMTTDHARCHAARTWPPFFLCTLSSVTSQRVLSSQPTGGLTVSTYTATSPGRKGTKGQQGRGWAQHRKMQMEHLLRHCCERCEGIAGGFQQYWCHPRPSCAVAGKPTLAINLLP
jgi:hypothetical protein